MRKTEVVFKRLIAVSTGLAAIFLLNACGNGGLLSGKLFKERAAETPAPSEEVFDKTFFREASGEPKTFLCAWAPEMGRGYYGENYLTHLANMVPHCNVEFDIAEDYLVAKMINPSYPDHNNPDHRARWKEVLKIPIVSHFYLERAKDAHGRETNEWIENTTRSHWSARPKIKLNLSGMEILDFLPGGGHRISSVEDIEQDPAQSFLGFSISTSSQWLGGEFQGRFRVNFMQFKHDETFKKVPYAQENSRYINILHVMGRRIEGSADAPELYAAHWDVRQPTKIYINGMPDELRPLAWKTIDNFNEEFVKIGAVPKGQKAFTYDKNDKGDMKHPFDLRKPSINWISDRRISAHSPLGIGMAHADMRNGKILWGSLNLYGGLLEKFINAYTPTSGSGANSSSAGLAAINPVDSFKALFTTLESPFGMAPQIDAFANMGTSKIEQLASDLPAQLIQQISTMGDGITEEQKAEMIAKTIKSSRELQPMINDALAVMAEERKKINSQLANAFRGGILGDGLEAQGAIDIAKALEDSGKKDIAAVLKEQDLKKRQDMIAALFSENSSLTVESDLTVENMAGAWANSPAQEKYSYSELLETVVMQLTMHEFGHFLGMGHQFKENILPERGTVPSRFLDDPETGLAAKATAAKHFTNQSTVMGYPNGRTEMMVETKNVVVGPHDNLVLRYLYNGEYPVYDTAKDDFAYFPVPSNGVIPRENEKTKLRTAYFPACNDYEASLGADAFCNRWDRGNKAEDIVRSYFENVSDNLLANLYSLVGGGGNDRYAENRMWYLALDSFSRIRLFYDEMRRYLSTDRKLKPWWDKMRMSEDALFEFSTACQSENPAGVSNEILKNIFSDAKMVDYCRANALALKRFQFFLNLPQADTNMVDTYNRFVSAGYLEGDTAHDFGHIFGSWYQLSNIPLKFSAMYTLTTANPYLLMGGLARNPYYDFKEDRNLYRSLYPTEYTSLISDAVLNNLRFRVTGEGEDNTFGRLIMGMGFMVPYQNWYSNDRNRIQTEYNTRLEEQTAFNASAVALMIDPIPPDSGPGSKPDHYRKFSGAVYDFQTGKTTPLSEIYLLPEGRVIARAPGMFLLPLPFSRLKFYAPKDVKAYVIAYRVTYDTPAYEKHALFALSVKARLENKYKEIVNACIEGVKGKAGTGLKSHFDVGIDGYEGIYIPPTIATDSGNESKRDFYKSLDDEFKKYNDKIGPMPEGYALPDMNTVCTNSLEGVSEIVSAAALLGGQWLGTTFNHMSQ